MFVYVINQMTLRAYKEDASANESVDVSELTDGRHRYAVALLLSSVVFLSAFLLQFICGTSLPINYSCF